MWDVCVSTPLNKRHAGESVTIENMEAKMAETLSPRYGFSRLIYKATFD